jgi:hypothetical protein
VLPNDAVSAVVAGVDGERLPRLQRQRGAIRDFVVRQSVDSLPRLDDLGRRIFVAQNLIADSGFDPH